MQFVSGAFDEKKMVEALKKIVNGKRVQVPVYDYVKNCMYVHVLSLSYMPLFNLVATLAMVVSLIVARQTST